MSDSEAAAVRSIDVECIGRRRMADVAVVFRDTMDRRENITAVERYWDSFRC
jgi:hypothetical protein